MPHLLIEYSANLGPDLDAPALMARLADAAVRTGVFPLAGVRVRCYPVEQYHIADGHPDNAFVHMMVRIGHGRSIEVRRKAGEALFAALTEALGPLYERGPLAISMEIVEIHPDLNFKQGNLRDYLKRREKGDKA